MGLGTKSATKEGEEKEERTMRRGKNDKKREEKIEKAERVLALSYKTTRPNGERLAKQLMKTRSGARHACTKNKMCVSSDLLAQADLILRKLCSGGVPLKFIHRLVCFKLLYDIDIHQHVGLQELP